MKTAGLTLRNEPGTKTRIGMHSRQKDSTPDLSWATASLVLDWSTWRDNLDSDHFPVEMKIHHGQRNSGKEQRPVVKWDRFRELLETEGSQDIEDCIRTALSEAKTKVLVKPGAPTPDNHLLNLWASRLQALQRYRKNRTLHLKIKLKRAAAKARQYSKQLGRERWRTHCGSFNALNGMGRAWRTYKGLNGAKRETRHAAQNLALKLNISEEEMAIRGWRIKRGTRYLRIEFKESDPVPNFLRIGGHQATFDNPGNKRVCRRCRLEGHIGVNCTTEHCDRCAVFGHATDGCTSDCRRCGGSHATVDCVARRSYSSMVAGSASSDFPVLSPAHEVTPPHPAAQTGAPTAPTKPQATVDQKNSQSELSEERPPPAPLPDAAGATSLETQTVAPAPSLYSADSYNL
ncbi:hypothetical protein HPB47_003064 [Ixodes persulcatus]|uniref:Uncharacterized protein n=1 Tax=Ixodes persulcatus TaxID=34615 RepID=A0AC60PL41_IXOPE|nr:hypothetical protein HPB47_003064 [Ixodes persulcatus]